MQAIRFSLLQVAVAAAVASAPFAASASTTLNTTGLEANAVLTLSTDAISGLVLDHISITPGGYATTLTTETDSNNADSIPVGQPLSFNLPITSFTANIGLLPPSLTPVKGSSVGSSLNIVGTTGQLSLANFTLDFTKDQVLADVVTPTGSSTQMDIYNFSGWVTLKL